MKSSVRGVFLKAVFSSFALLLSLHAQASFVTFSDRTTFLSTTGTTSATGPIPNLGRMFIGPTTVGDVTFSQAPPGGPVWIGSGDLPDWTPVNPGNDIAIDGLEDFNVDLASSVFAFGFDFVEATPVDLSAPTFAVTLLGGSGIVGAFTFNRPIGEPAFVGVWSDVSFNRVEIRDLTGSAGDEYFGEFYTSAVPIPPAVWLFGTGLIGLIGVARRKV